MDIKICKLCGRPIISEHKLYVCGNCKETDDATFAKIEQYLNTHPFSNALDVSAGCGISTKEVIRYIDEGRIEVVDAKKMR